MVLVNRDAVTGTAVLGRAGSIGAMLRQTDGETRITLIALLPALGVLVWQAGMPFVQLAGLCVVLALFWIWLFARLRQRTADLHAIASAMVFAIMLTPETPLWQAALSLSFGLTLGSLVFGGRGFAFLHPALAALAFQYFSFPTTAEVSHGVILALAIVAGGLLMLATGRLSWRTLAGLAIALLVAEAWLAGFDHLGRLAQPFSLMTILFLVGDPGSSGATRPGRLLHGMLAGVLMLVFGLGGKGFASPHSLVFAALLAAVLVPLVDRLVIMAHAYRRRLRLERL